ncbi:type II toxin-antitoxin system RelE/ParE family toxin [uncultured Enterovirga sp.]|uniref:type II toxin-antitoxin system RelE/ParE family toxin n=1 Tax=uncultured Enterovirga sp. TaxID=2026352 RepID=UPI0035C94F30
MLTVILSAEAEADLERICDYIAERNPGRAISFIVELRGRILALVDAPPAFPVLPGRERSGLRRRSYRDYLILYRISERYIEIVRVVHGARDYESMLDLDDKT